MYFIPSSCNCKVAKLFSSHRPVCSQIANKRDKKKKTLKRNEEQKIFNLCKE